MMVKVSLKAGPIVQPAEIKFKEIIDRVFRDEGLKRIKAAFYIYYAPERFGPIMRLRMMNVENIVWTEFQLNDDFTEEDMVHGINEMRSTLNTVKLEGVKHATS